MTGFILQVHGPNGHSPYGLFLDLGDMTTPTGLYVGPPLIVGKTYIYEGLFKLNVTSINKNIASFAYMLVSCDVWHARLGYVDYSLPKRHELRINP